MYAFSVLSTLTLTSFSARVRTRKAKAAVVQTPPTGSMTFSLVSETSASPMTRLGRTHR